MGTRSSSSWWAAFFIDTRGSTCRTLPVQRPSRDRRPSCPGSVTRNRLGRPGPCPTPRRGPQTSHDVTPEVRGGGAVGTGRGPEGDNGDTNRVLLLCWFEFWEGDGTRHPQTQISGVGIRGTVSPSPTEGPLLPFVTVEGAVEVWSGRTGNLDPWLFPQKTRTDTRTTTKGSSVLLP